MSSLTWKVIFSCRGMYKIISYIIRKAMLNIYIANIKNNRKKSEINTEHPLTYMNISDNICIIQI
jgi:hypothetical protein